jgi:hypothetical protein
MNAQMRGKIRKIKALGELGGKRTIPDAQSKGGLYVILDRGIGWSHTGICIMSVTPAM